MKIEDSINKARENVPFLVRLSSSPPVAAKFNAVVMFNPLPSSPKAKAPAFCSLALKAAAPRKAAFMQNC